MTSPKTEIMLAVILAFFAFLSIVFVIMDAAWAIWWKIGDVRVWYQNRKLNRGGRMPSIIER